MCKRFIVAILSLISAGISCSRGPAEKAAEINPQVLELMQTVSSDALAVICSDKCGEAVEFLNTDNPLSSLDLSGFANAPAAVSLSYEGRLRANLSINAGKKATDSTATVSSLLAQVKELNLYSNFIPASKESDAFIIISSSESQMNAVKRHLTEGRSILEADKFYDALGKSEGSKDLIVIRNRGVSRLLPSSITTDIYSRRDICSFIEGFSDWIVMVPQKNGSFSIKSTQGEPQSYFANMMESLDGERLKAESFIPDSATFMLSLAIPSSAFRDAYERHKDASVRLGSYKRKLESLKTDTKKDPLKWEKEIGVKEISVFIWKGEQFLLVRSPNKADEREIKENPYRGFSSALYGKAFEIKDDSFYTSCRGWYIFGRQESLSELLESCSSRETKQKTNRPECHLVIKYGSYSLVWDKNEFTLWNSNL